MTESLKQRIVGAFVLIALAIIIVPLVFDFSAEREVDTNSKIPPMPEVEAAVVPEPIKPDNIIPAKSVNEIFSLDADPEQKEPVMDEVPALSPEGLPAGWVLQVGSFRDKSAAENLVSRLLKDGYRAFIREKKSEKGTLSRVYIGPKVLKQKLLQEKKSIDKKYGVDSLLIRFEP